MYNPAKLFVAFACACVLGSVTANAAPRNEAEEQLNAAANDYANQKWEQAAEEFRNFMRENPGHAKHDKAAYFEGESLVQCGKYAEAYSIFLDLLNDSPTGTYAKQSMFRAGEAALLSGRLDEAKVRLYQFHATYPDDKLNAMVLMYQAEMAMQTNDPVEAGKLYRESIVHFSDQPTVDQCRLGMAQALMQQKQTDAANTILRDLSQRDHSPWAEMALLQLGDQATAAGRNQQAFELFDSVLQRFPNGPLTPQAEFQRGHALYLLGRYDDAQHDFSDLINKQQLVEESKAWLVQTIKSKKQYTVAADTLGAALQNDQEKSDAQMALPTARRATPEEVIESKTAHKPSEQPAAPKVVESKPSKKAAEQSAAEKKLADSKAAKRTLQQPAAEIEPSDKIAQDNSAAQQSAPRRSLLQPTLARPPIEVSAAEPKPQKASKSVAAPAQKSNDLATDLPAIQNVATEKLAADDAPAAKTAAEKTVALEEQQRRHAAVIRFHTAEAMIRTGDYRRAVGTLQVVDAAADDPPSLANRYLLAVALQGVKRNDEAMGVLKDLSTIIDDKLSVLATDGPADPAAVNSQFLSDDRDTLRALRGNVYLARATSLVAGEKFAEAIEPLQKYIAMGRQDVGTERARSALAICYARTNHLDESRQALDELRAKNPDSATILPTTQQVAQAAYAAGKYDIAAELFTTLTTAGNPSDSIAKGLAGLGFSRAQLGDHETAERVFAQFLEHYPIDARAPEVALARGQSLEHLGRDAAADTVYRQAIAKYRAAPQMPALLSASAHLHDRLGENEEAVQLYQQLVRDYPKCAEIDGALYGWAWSLRDMGRGTESDKLFRQIHDEHADSHFWADSTYRLAERASQRGDRAAAVELIQPLLEGNCPVPVLQHALYLQAQMAIAEHRWDDAETPLQRLVTEFPNGELSTAAEFWLAEAAYRTNDLAAAQQRFDKLAEHITNHNEHWTAIVPLRRAQLLAGQKQWAQSRELAETIARDYPEFDQQYEADYLIGRCFMADTAYDDARTAFTRVIKSAAGGKTETAAQAQWMIADSYFQQENYSIALKEYMRVEMVYPYPHWQAAALLQAGKCHEKLGQSKEAAELYAHMLEKYPQTEFTADANQRLQETIRR